MAYHTYINISSKIDLKKGEHRGINVIWLDFHGRPEWLAKIKVLSGIKYSRTHTKWYLPYDLEQLNAFVRLGIPYTIIGARASTEALQSEQDVVEDDPTSSRDDTTIATQERDDIRRPSIGKEGQDIQDNIIVSWTGKGMAIALPYRADDIAFVRSLQGAYWHPKHHNWVCKPTIANLKKIQQRWSILDTETYDDWLQKMAILAHPCKLSLYRSPKYEGSICIEIIGYGANHHLIKKIGDISYHQEDKLYTTRLSWAELSDICDGYKLLGYAIHNRLVECLSQDEASSKADKVSFLLSKLPKKHYSSLQKMADCMLRLNYGLSTIRSYLYRISGLMEYIGKMDFEAITADEVNEYIEGLNKIDASLSRINAVYSAVKLYHTRVIFDEDFQISKLERPRKKSKLPQIMSEGEILHMIEEIDNIKHLSIFYLLYGCGLRKGELLSLKVDDISWSRNQIHIKDAKGQKDRIIPMSPHIKDILEHYINSYKPVRYVFESRRAGQAYSSSSVSQIIKRAAKRAGITKRITPHMLRHAYATHLLDHGVSLPKIQALLGHKDVKTTMIYTHLTNKDIKSVSSPLDRVLKKKRNSDNKNV